MTPNISDVARQHLVLLATESHVHEPVITILRGRLITGEDTGWSVALIERASLGSLPVAVIPRRGGTPGGPQCIACHPWETLLDRATQRATRPGAVAGGFGLLR
jgi:hypothetical protein